MSISQLLHRLFTRQDEPTIIYECRYCGTTVNSQTDPCPYCEPTVANCHNVCENACVTDDGRGHARYGSSDVRDRDRGSARTIWNGWRSDNRDTDSIVPEKLPYLFRNPPHSSLRFRISRLETVKTYMLLQEKGHV